LTSAEEKKILSEEIDDYELETEVNNLRNQARDLLDFELSKKMMLNEIYLHEEPLAIIFEDQQKNVVTFEALNIENSKISSYFSSGSSENIKEIKSDNIVITYILEKSGSSNYVNSIISCGNSELKLKMNLWLKEFDPLEIEKHAKLMKCKK
jgi:hypothetical protein